MSSLGKGAEVNKPAVLTPTSQSFRLLLRVAPDSFKCIFARHCGLRSAKYAAFSLCSLKSGGFEPTKSIGFAGRGYNVVNVLLARTPTQAGRASVILVSFDGELYIFWADED